MFLKMKFLKYSGNMELKYKGSFKRDFNINNQTIVKAVYEAVINIKTASNISKINDLKKT